MRCSGRSGMAWELEPEDCAASFAVMEADPTLHHLDQALADGETEPGAAFLAGRRRVGLVEAAEDACPECLGNARALVVHADAQETGNLLGRDRDHFAFGRELG